MSLNTLVQATRLGDVSNQPSDLRVICVRYNLSLFGTQDNLAENRISLFVGLAKFNTMQSKKMF